MPLSPTQFRLVACRRLLEVAPAGECIEPEMRAAWWSDVKGYASPALFEHLQRAFDMQPRAALAADDIMAIVDLALDQLKPLPESTHGGHHTAIDE